MSQLARFGRKTNTKLDVGLSDDEEARSDRIQGMGPTGTVAKICTGIVRRQNIALQKWLTRNLKFRYEFALKVDVP